MTTTNKQQTGDEQGSVSKAQHTPGPWKIKIVDGGYTKFELLNRPDSIEQAWANARLIEAAPSMLAENKRLREALENAIDCFSNYIPKQSRGYKEGCFNYITDGVEMGCSCPICKARSALDQSVK